MPRKSSPYTHPPITEAVIEIVFSGELNSNALEKCIKKFKKNYPTAKTVFRDFQIQLLVSEDGEHTPSASKGTKGLRLESKDAADVLQFFPNRLSLSRLAPYNGWDAFSAEFVQVWDYVKKTSRSQAIERMATRFINRIDIPVTSIEEPIPVQDYLKVGVTAPDQVSIGNYQAAIHIIIDPQTGAVVRTGTANPVVPDTGALLLDIDCFIDGQGLSTDKEVLAKLQRLHDLKNDMFENFITDKAREIFDRGIS